LRALDDDDGWIEGFRNDLSKAINRLAGEPPRIFFDRTELMTSDLWESRIATALERSQLAVAILSPSYSRSEWCRREWASFAGREGELRANRTFAEDRGLIFPILFSPLGRGRYADGDEEFVKAVGKRQMVDATSLVEGAPVRPAQVRGLAEQVLDTVDEPRAATRDAKSEKKSTSPDVTIRDSGSGLEWTGSFSPSELSYEAALM
jgi:hypothetical protein